VTLAGIIDQRGETFVLSDEKQLRPQVTLRPKGFSSDNFARFVGFRARIKGELSRRGDTEVLTVSSLAEVQPITGSEGERK
jgi:hypothetical protein